MAAAYRMLALLLLVLPLLGCGFRKPDVDRVALTRRQIDLEIRELKRAQLHFPHVAYSLETYRSASERLALKTEADFQHPVLYSAAMGPSHDKPAMMIAAGWLYSGSTEVTVELLDIDGRIIATYPPVETSAFRIPDESSINHRWEGLIMLAADPVESKNVGLPPTIRVPSMDATRIKSLRLRTRAGGIETIEVYSVPDEH